MTIGSDLRCNDIPFPATREVVLGMVLLKAPFVDLSAKETFDYSGTPLERPGMSN